MRELKFRSCQQYIGIKDKNGVEIYEGDIVKAVTKNGEEIINTITGEIYFDEKKLCYSVKSNDPRPLAMDRWEFEVINYKKNVKSNNKKG